jgi:hypothetical protein
LQDDEEDPSNRYTANLYWTLLQVRRDNDRDTGVGKKKSGIGAMKFLHVVLALGLLLLREGLEPALAGKITNEPQGFNGYTWGARIAEYPSLKLAKDSAVAHPLPNVDVYENPGEVLTLNGVTISKVLYRFYKNQLGSVQLAYEGKENREKLIQWVEEQYGQLPPVERKQKQIEWHGESTVITLDYNAMTNLGLLWFTYLVLTPFDSRATDGY